MLVLAGLAPGEQPLCGAGSMAAGTDLAAPGELGPGGPAALDRARRLGEDVVVWA